MRNYKTTRAQRESLYQLFNRNPDGSPTYRHFRKRAKYVHLWNGLEIWWCDMFIGIEQDGYTHS